MPISSIAPFFSCHIICEENVGCHEEERTETGYNTEGYEKIHTGNIVTWGHPKWGNLRGEWSEGWDWRLLKAEIQLG